MLATSVVLVVLLLGGAQSQTEDTKTAEKIGKFCASIIIKLAF